MDAGRRGYFDGSDEGLAEGASRGKGLESSDSFTLLQDAEGNQYLYGNCYRDEESSSAHLWKEADGSALDITPQKWLEPMDMDGYRFYDTPQYVTLTEDGLLVGLSYFPWMLYWHRTEAW